MSKEYKQFDIVQVADLLYDHMPQSEYLCPFHNDHHPGSFKIFPRTNSFKCFSCGAYGGSVKLTMQMKHCSKEEALEYLGEDIRQIKTDTKRVNKPKYPIAAKEEIDAVYRILSKGLQLVGAQDCLSKEHRQALLDRGFQIEDIDRNAYFTMPNRECIPVILEELYNAGLDPEILKYVPGFYQYRVSKKFDMVMIEGIGIPIRDMQGNIIAIQIRKDHIEAHENRYVWLSSGWITENVKAQKVLEGGSSTGAVLDVIQPTIHRHTYIMITEGHFKADAFSAYYNCVSIALPGITNQNGVSDIIKQLNPSKVYIGFDMDMYKNYRVYEQACKLADTIRKLGKRVVWCSWNPQYGKGIDDVLLRHGKKYIHESSHEAFVQFYKKYLSTMKKDYHFENNDDIDQVDEELSYDTFVFLIARELWK